MKTHFIDSLDSALKRVEQGESLTAVLHDYPTQAEDLAPLLQSADLLSECKPVIMPSQEELLADQQLFIDQIAQLPVPAVSPSPFVRLNSWMAHRLSWLGLNPNQTKKEHKNMGTLLLKATLILTIIFGSVGGTAVMAAESLPDSPLYPAKLMVEGARLSFASDQVEQAEIHLDIAAERLREMERLMVDSQMADNALLERAEHHLGVAFDLAAEMPVQEMAGILMQTQTMVQTQTRAFNEIEDQIPVEVQPVFNQVQKMLQNNGEIAAAGLQDPQLLRHRHTVNRPETAPEQPVMGSPAIIITPTQTITTPVRIGPIGPCGNNEDCDPAGDGPYGPGHQGPNPEESGEGVGPGRPEDIPNLGGSPDDPGSGDEPGNPDSGCGDCDQGEQNGYGPRPEDSGNGSGIPGGSEEGIPIGGQSQNGTQYQAPENNAPPPALETESSPDQNDSHSGTGKGN